MSDDLVRRLECYADLNDAVYHPWVYKECADRIKKLVEENGVLFAANVRLNSRADLDCDHYRDRIEKLEAALRELSTDWDCCVVSKNMKLIARKALEGKDD
ncbi:MAG: hypothetical protein AMJ59_12820 [Gammaproteobacteria bacterium SG8_31]|nr:MAG: hypothetical protein AMJ59_12820 [Gammaproteobacteria bacterium SG8_31]